MSENKVISNESIRRLLKDVKQIIKHPLTDNGVYYSHDEFNITKGYAMIVGPQDTPYFGGYYFFEFDFPYDYPYNPPKVTYHTNDGFTRFNPNLYVNGKVCLSIINTWSGEPWSSCQTITSVLNTLCTVLNDSPLLNEPGQNKDSSNFLHYQRSIEFKNIDFAICDLLIHKETKIPFQFRQFYTFMKNHFINNYEKILDFVKTKSITTVKYAEILHLYSMNTLIDYQELEKKLINTKNIIENEK